jgi:hypothetical protein
MDLKSVYVQRSSMFTVNTILYLSCRISCMFWPNMATFKLMARTVEWVWDLKTSLVYWYIKKMGFRSQNFTCLLLYQKNGLQISKLHLFVVIPKNGLQISKLHVFVVIPKKWVWDSKTSLVCYYIKKMRLRSQNFTCLLLC